ncbi:MAG TPA: DUF445 family protein, partial [Chitinophagaceae bacterium]
ILGFKLQGVFPKKQLQIAENLGQVVANELLSFRDIEEKMTNPEKIKGMIPVLEQHIDHFLRYKLSDAMPVLSMFIGEGTINKIKGIFVTELEELFPELIKQYLSSVENELDLQKIVTDKVAAFSSEKLEIILNHILTKEFRFVEVIGTILGFMIGLLQIFFSYLVR